MSGEIRKEDSKMLAVYRAVLALIFSFGLAAVSFGQTTGNTQTAMMPVASAKNVTEGVMPVFTNYREIKIGTTADEVRGKLGKAKTDDENGFYYEFSDNESAQMMIDKDKKVRMISVIYSSENENAPKFEDVFGKEIAVEAKPDGSIYHLVDYPKAGYWVAYSRTAGETPVIAITMQKMRAMK